ncbi:unnamed protein product [Bemisia tabaci]|uniref:Metalloendopeptidase n=1 Tax=Bemisia tabaci TaxID=7038 RepID=A0A9P0F8V9_BEMTA|nr:unnamed protein product [Bemisia tabaci]
MFIFVSVLLVFTERVNGRETILHDGQVHHVEDEFAELRSKKMLKRPKLLWRGAAVIYSINSSIGKKYFAHATLGKTGGRTFLQVHRRYWTKSMLLHELGHTLSLHHEHQRSDGDLYLDTLEENIRKNRKSKLPTQQLKSGERWGAPTKLSDGDVRRIQDLYRCIAIQQGRVEGGRLGATPPGDITPGRVLYKYGKIKDEREEMKTKEGKKG